MVYPKIPLAQSIIQICLAKGINNIVISPGSRNAPLTIGFVNNPDFNCYSIADERCAAFFALGMAQQIQKPVAVVCTSGSALLNYYPAFAEAFYSQIPLIVISADRPQSKIDIGDGQTIRQENVFKNHSLYNANLTEEVSAENDLKINEAINKAVAEKARFISMRPLKSLCTKPFPNWLSSRPFWILFQRKKEIDINQIKAFADIWNQSKKKLILVGENKPNLIDAEIIEALAKDESVVVMTENTSNLHHPSFLNNIDTIITPFAPKEFQELQPDILLTFGGMVVSKRIKAF